MNFTDCYNYPWMKDWFKRNLVEDLKCKNLTSDKILATNFSRSYFYITVEHVRQAMIENGFKHENVNNEYSYYISHTSPAFVVFSKHWE